MALHLFEEPDLMSEVLKWYSKTSVYEPSYATALMQTALICKGAQRAVAVHLTERRERLLARVDTLRCAIGHCLAPHRAEAPLTWSAVF